ncbi:LPD1 domain-containing protein [Lactobacillus crispatus]|uniref:LPD1 domain-containing protein n=1 Tax=Lactobacillus crispatus TaxID=47770 RepID=UPI00076115E4|nr:LPD1 domain-containing protein [Lactobacillus crispatus]KWU13816.1 hypothetical protein AEM00_11010 [Lactobacillus crispatus]UAY40732.1 hypothetical protein LAE51_12815 [Lactobacillus crispatus]
MTVKITDLMKNTLGISKVSNKIKLNPDDNISIMFAKTAKFIYKNGLINGDWTEKDFIDGIKADLAHVLNIEKVYPSDTDPSTINSKYILSKEQEQLICSLGKFRKTDNSYYRWQNYVYEVTYEKGDRTLVVVDPLSAYVRNENKGYTLSSYKFSFNGSSHIDLYNGSYIVGKIKLLKRLLKKACTEKQCQEFAKKYSFMNFVPDRIPFKFKQFAAELLFGSSDSDHFKKDKKIEQAITNGTWNPDTGELHYMGGYYSDYGVANSLENNAFIDWISQYLFDTFSFILQAQAEQRDASNSHAKFFQQKKNINKEKRQAMHKLSDLLKDYVKGVEIDNDVDLNKLNKLIPTIKETFPLLPKAQDGSKPILRFRKLRNLKAIGVYTCFNDTIALDFRSIGNITGLQAFVHEYGHFLDYHSESETALSITDSKFVNGVLDPVVNYLKKFRNTGFMNQGKFGFDYLCTPTEVFARAFELYVSDCGLDNDFISDPENYNSGRLDRYLCFKNVRQDIIIYFDKLFPSLRGNIQKYNQLVKAGQTSASIPTNVSDKKVDSNKSVEKAENDKTSDSSISKPVIDITVNKEEQVYQTTLF